MCKCERDIPVRKQAERPAIIGLLGLLALGAVLSACTTLDARDREADIAGALRERYPAGTPLRDIEGSLGEFGLQNEEYTEDKRPTGVIIRTLKADLTPRKTPDFWLQDHGQVTFYFNAERQLEYLKVKKFHGERD
jgi:hypothetical protein